MKEKPILFNSEMVKAILEERKFQTRRAIKGYWTDVIQDTDIIDNKEISLGFEDENGDWHKTESVCPYGKTGDRLWVRETFYDGDGWYDLTPDLEWKNVKFENKCTWVDYRATMTNEQKKEYAENPWKWKPSIFMPKKYCRIWLEITNIRVERLQEISIQDAIDEGIYSEFDGTHSWYENYTKNGEPAMFKYPSRAIKSFQSLWDQINEKRGYSWDSNPWVWVVEFKKIKTD